MKIIGSDGSVPRLFETCAKEQGRYALHLIDAKERTVKGERFMRCAATDGRVVVRVDVPAGDDDTPGFIPVDAWKRAAKAQSKRGNIEEHVLDAEAAVTVSESKDTTSEFERPVDGDFPDYEKVIPEFLMKPHLGGYLEVSFNPLLLVKAAKAMGMLKGQECVTLRVPTDRTGKAIVGGPIGLLTMNDDAIGALMPISRDEALLATESLDPEFNAPAPDASKP